MKVSDLIDLLGNIPEVKFIRTNTTGRFHASIYEGTKGNPIIVDTTDENMDRTVILGLFDEMGIDPYFDDFIPED